MFSRNILDTGSRGGGWICCESKKKNNLLHLPPLRSRCVGGSRDGIIEPRTVATLALAVGRSNYSPLLSKCSAEKKTNLVLFVLSY
jgi:hypothetical protein